MRRARYCLVLLCLCSVMTAKAWGASSGEVTTYPQVADTSIQERLRWAEHAGADYADGYWIGYSIERLSDPDSWIGTIYTRHEENLPLSEIVGSRPVDQRSRTGAYETPGKVLRATAILLHIPAGAAAISEASGVRVSDMDCFVDLDDEPLVWLGMTEQEESFQFLRETYPGMQSGDAKEDVIYAIGIHRQTAVVTPFLKAVVTGDDDDRYRKEAVFWLAMQEGADIPAFLYETIGTDPSMAVREEAVFSLGQIKATDSFDLLKMVACTAENVSLREEAVFWLAESGNPDALPALRDIIADDPSIKLREEAVFGLSRMDLDDALDTLIDIARHSADEKVQEQAVFWLGQMASQRATVALADIAYDVDTVELQKQAVFALSQLKHGDGVSKLIEIAEEHPSGEVRKQAIFWLGESGDPRAVDAIEGILRAD